MPGNELTLEKLRVKERLEAVEKHMEDGEKNRQTLMKGFEEMTGTVRSMEKTLFGEKGQVGLAQRMDAVLKIADGIKWVLTKIFLAICSAIALAVLPAILKYVAMALTKHVGG